MSEVSGMYKIAVLGERESVMGFAALGLTVFPVNSAEEAAEVLPGLGADAVGLNCSSGPDQMGTVVRMMKKAAPDTPIAAKPNAGLPTITETGEAVYHMNPEDFARHMRALKQDGASLLGGCCGTGSAYIEALRALR